MPVPSNPQDLINIIREKLFNNTSGLIEEPDLREVLENIVKVLDAKFSMFSPNLTEEQYAQWNLILDFMLRETKGVLTTSSPAPTGNAAIGKYLLSGAGTFTNLGGLVATADKLNYAYFDGTTWSKVEVAIPAPVENHYHTVNNITENITQNITQQVIDPSSITLEPNYYNSQTGGQQEIAANVIKRISKHSKQALTYIETTLNENGDAISDADVTGDGLFIKEGGKYYMQVLPAVIDVRNLGILPDNTDQTAKFNAILQRFKKKGAAFVFSADEYRFDGQITIPYELTSGDFPYQKPFTFIGQGAAFNGKLIPETLQFGTTLKMSYSGSEAKIRTLGLGYLKISGIAFKDDSGSTTPFIYSRYTTVHILENSFHGSKWQLECNQDAIIFGGTIDSETGSDWGGGFQGYGSIIRGNYFDGIRRAFLGRIFANGIVISDNTMWFSCGNANGGAIEFNNSGSIQAVAGNVIENNLCEMIGYKHFAKVVGLNNSSFINNNLFDTENNTTSYYDFNDSNFNKVIAGIGDKKPLLSGNSNDSTMVLNSSQSQSSMIPSIKTNGLTIKAENSSIAESAKVSDASGNLWFTRIFNGKDVQLIQQLANGGEVVVQQIQDYNDGYYSFVFGGVNPRLDSNAGMRVRANIGEELFLGDKANTGITILNSEIIMKPSGGIYKNSLFIDSADGKLKFQDASGNIHALY